jgi:MFS transporter, DHA2 family, multidrug resistance protein
MTSFVKPPPPPPPQPSPITLDTILAGISAFAAAWMVQMAVRYFALQAGDVDGALGVDSDLGSWLSTAYAVAEPLGVLFGAWMGIIFSLRRMLLASVTLFLVADLIPLIIPGYDTLFFARVITGLAGGAIMPQCIIIQIRIWGPTRIALALGLYVSAPTAGGAFGGIVGAWGVEYLGWTAIFWAPLLLGFVSLVTGIIGLKREPINWRPLVHADLSGMIYLGAAIAFFAFAVNQGDRMRWLQSTVILGSFLAFGVCLFCFVMREWHIVRHPILWVKLYKRRNILLTALGALPLTLAISMSGVIVPFALTQLRFFRPEQISTVLWSACWPQLPAYALCIWILTKKLCEVRALFITGLALVAIGAFFDITVTSEWESGELYMGQIMQGVGLPFIALPLVTLLAGDLRPPAESIPAAAIFNLSRVLLGAVSNAWATTSLRLNSQAKFSQLLENTGLYPANEGTGLAVLSVKIARMENDPWRAKAETVATFAMTARRQAAALGASHSLATLGVVLFLSCLLVLVMAELGWGKWLRPHEKRS